MVYSKAFDGISCQKYLLSPGAKERLVQITGPNEEKINCAKQLIEDTIRRNASPVRMDESGQGAVGAGSCSSLTSSNSDEALPRANRNSILFPAGGAQAMTQAPYTVPNQTNQFTGTHSGGHKSRIASSGASNPVLLHSLSTNDASLGEYKYTVNVGQNTLKITGDCFDLVRAAKLILDEYFGSSEFMSYIDAADSVLMHSASTASLGTSFSTPTSSIPPSHQLSSASPFIDSGIGLNVMAASQLSGQFNNQNSIENDDDVFVIEDDETVTPVTSTKTGAAAAPSLPQPNGLTRSRRSHFSHGDVNQDTNKDANAKSSGVRVTYEAERLVYFSKSPHSWALPRDWLKICEFHPTIIRNKVCESDNTNNNNNTITKNNNIHNHTSVNHANYDKVASKFIGNNSHPISSYHRRNGALLSQ